MKTTSVQIKHKYHHPVLSACSKMLLGDSLAMVNQNCVRIILTHSDMTFEFVHGLPLGQSMSKS